MSDFWFYFNLGLHYVLDWKAYELILFLILICAPYTFAAWKKLLALVTLFTFGLIISVLLEIYGVVNVSQGMIGFLVPTTILATALFTLFTAGNEQKIEKTRAFYILAIFFGLIQGFDLASIPDNFGTRGRIISIFEFAMGVEVAQIIVVLILFIVAFIFQSVFHYNKRDWVLVVTSLVIGMTIPMLYNNWIF